MEQPGAGAVALGVCVHLLKFRVFVLPVTSRCLAEGAWVQGDGQRGSTEVHGISGTDGVAVSAAQGTACSAETRADPGGLQQKVSLWAGVLGATEDRGVIFLSAQKIDFYEKKALLGGELLPWGHGHARDTFPDVSDVEAS